ncbi:hypothetical protein [Actinokineospora sp. NBRC 105648]|uniref:hypothetical protein n=1 Tax=Actinokineospora sp. NBRC 105648 TaxID=3032206 RepID=UPI0024A543AA|nr:hypothetical protein [Actinokineospora sp. NBRC 105648]GLZ37910.1 hypothetical protein Acsp05_15340 [Actinokineospora sp. NBRC 105648]
MVIVLSDEVRVLLIDLENSVGGSTPRRRVLVARVEAVLAAAGTVHHVVAGYSGADLADDLVGSALAEMGVSALRVAPGPNAAELVLLAHARRVHASLGCRSFLVASADHRFAELADLGRLELVVWHDQPVATQLKDAAHRIHRIARPSSTTDAAGPDPLATPTRPEPVLDGGSAGRRAGLREMATAVLTGIGIGIGQRLVESLARRQRPR